MKLFRKERQLGYHVYWAQKLWCTHGNTKQRLRARLKKSKKKIRGARKKRLLQEEKQKYPKGRPMYKKEAPPHRQIIFTKDIERLMHCRPRTAREFLSRLRKILGKKKGEIVTLTEFCSKTPFTKEDVIPYLV